MNSDDLLAPPAKAVAARLGRLRFSVAELLVALVVLIVAYPFLNLLEYGAIVEDALFSLVLLSAVLAVGGERRTLVWGIALVIPVLVGQWSDTDWLRTHAVGQGEFPMLVFLLFVVFHLLRHVLRAPHVNSEVPCAGIVIYLMLGLLWGFAYMLVDRLVPGSFVYTPGTAGQAMAGFNALYFIFVTLGTVGYGDFVPVSPIARTLAMTEAMTGTLYLAILISRLVSLHASASPSRKQR
jgi:hypothetical protein